jgi:hypothetical protein
MVADQLDTLIKETNNMRLQIQDLETQIVEKNKTIEDLEIKVSDLTDSPDILIEATNTVEKLATQNDMIKFYIICGGVVVGSLIVISLLNHFLPGLFSTKAWIPAPIYNTLQDYTGLFQEKQIFTITDNKCNLEWLVSVINQKKAEIAVKPNGANDFISASDYVSKLQGDAGIMIRGSSSTTQSIINAVPQASVTQNTTALDIVNTATQSFPSAQQTAEIATKLSGLI